MNRAEKKKTDADDFLDRVRVDYKKSVDVISKEYEARKDEYNTLIGPLNGERLLLRDEIRDMYAFLNRLGNIGKELTVFDYEIEDSAPVLSPDKTDDITSPVYKGGFFSRGKDNKAMINYNANILNVEQEYLNDLSAKRLAVKYLGIAAKIARIYLNTVVFVKDFIKLKVLPELSFINASLTADGVLNEVISGGDASAAHMTGIAEYKDTNKDIHYRFVQNVHDFYRISAAFFKEKILTNFLADKVITIEEEEEFIKTVEEIYDKANDVIREKVL